MKVTLISIAIAAALITTSCTGNSEQRTERSLSEKISTCENPDSLRAYVNEAKDYTQKLIEQGKFEEASAFIDSISPAIKDKAPALMGTFVALKGKVKVDETAEKVKDALKEGVEQVTDKAQEGVGNITGKAEDAAAKVKNKAAEAADQAGEAVNKATDKAADAVNKATDKFKKK